MLENTLVEYKLLEISRLNCSSKYFYCKMTVKCVAYCCLKTYSFPFITTKKKSLGLYIMFEYYPELIYLLN